KTINLPISSLTRTQVANINFTSSNTSSLWKHLDNPTLFNSFYGCTNAYILEYPFYSTYRDEIVQNIKDYTKVYTYLSSVHHISDFNRRLQVDDAYFNKAILYNDQQ